MSLLPQFCVNRRADSVLKQRKKILGAEVSKKGDADNLLRYGRNHFYFFPWKRCNYKQSFLLSTPLAKFSLFIEGTLYVFPRSLPLINHSSFFLSNLSIKNLLPLLKICIFFQRPIRCSRIKIDRNQQIWIFKKIYKIYIKLSATFFCRSLRLYDKE